MTTEPKDRDDVLQMAAHWYGCLLTARPTMLDHNADPSYRMLMMKAIIADAEALTELVYGRDDDTTATLPVPPVYAG